MTKFRKWLDNRKLTIEQFSIEVGLHYNTVARWASDAKRQPREPYLKAVEAKYPDCPLGK